MGATEIYLARPWLAHYAPGVPAEVEVPQKSIGQAFDEATTRAPERTAGGVYGRAITYRELRDATDRLACALARLGLKKGERVALYLLNSPQFIIGYFAALKCGAVVTPISPVYTSHEVRYQLEDSGARVVICQDILFEKVEKSGAKLDWVVVTSVDEYLPALKRWFGKKVEMPKGARIHGLQELLKSHPPEAPAVAIDPRSDLAALPYTGGTTGSPKGVMLTHYNMMASQVSGQAVFPNFEAGEGEILALPPVFHISGPGAITRYAMIHGDLPAVFTHPHTQAILAARGRYPPTRVCGV